MSTLTIFQFEQQGIIKLSQIDPFYEAEEWASTGLCSDGQYYLSSFFVEPADLVRFCLEHKTSIVKIDWQSSTAEVQPGSIEQDIFMPIWESPYHKDCLHIDVHNTGEGTGKATFYLNLQTLTKNYRKKTAILQEQLHKLREEKAKQLNIEKQAKSRKCEEFKFESKLEAFLQVNEIEVQRQVRAQDRILDLWIPDQLIIECKAGKISGNDACQAIDYLATFEIDILLIGTGMSRSAERAIVAANKMCSKACILFVTQEASFNYLKGVTK